MTGPAFFSFDDTAPTVPFSLSLHDALPICAFALRTELGEVVRRRRGEIALYTLGMLGVLIALGVQRDLRSEEHTSELQSHHELVCRLLLEKKKIFFWLHL